MGIRHLVAAAVATLILPQAASAEQAVEAAIRAWVAAVDAMPEWTASFGSITYDSASDTALVTDLSFRAGPATPMAGTVIRLATLAVAGYAEKPDGGFRARSITADGGTLEAGFIKLAVHDVSLEGLSVPTLDSFAFDRMQPFSSLMRAYGEAIKIDLDHARIASLDLDQTFEGVTSKIVYENLSLDRFNQGKVASFGAGPIRMDSPTPDGLIRMRIGSAVSRDIDLGAFVHVYSPDSYGDTGGDMVWRNGAAFTSYNDIAMDVPGARITIDSVVAEDFRLRQPPISFAGFIDRVMVYPNMSSDRVERLAKRYVPAMFAAFSIGRFAMLDLKVDAMGIDHFVMKDFHIDDLSIDGLGEFGIGGLEGVVQGQGAMRLGRFAIGGVTFGGYDALTAIIAAEDARPRIDTSDLLPHVGYVELGGLEVQTPDIRRMTLDSFRAAATEYIGVVPSGGSVELVGLAVPVSAIAEPEARDILRRLGYDDIVLGFGMIGRYDEAAQRFELEDLHYSIRDMGVLSLSGAVAGLPFEAFGDERLLEAALPQLRLERASFTFKDESIVGRGLDLLAEYMKAPPTLFREQFADAMPFLLSIAVQNDPKLLAIVNKSGLFKQLTPVVRDFVANPGSSITISANPPAPVAFQAIADAVENAPETVASLLGLAISGEKGALPVPQPTVPPEEPGGMTPPAAPGQPDGGGNQAAPPPSDEGGEDRGQRHGAAD
jgi:hypothetical protein